MLIHAHRRELLTVDQVAAQLGLHPMIVRRKIRLGEIPAVQISGRGSAIRTPTQALISTLQRGRTGPTEERAL